MDGDPPGAGLVCSWQRCRKNGTERAGHGLMKVTSTTVFIMLKHLLFKQEVGAGYIEGLVFYNSLSKGPAQHLLFAISNRRCML